MLENKFRHKYYSANLITVTKSKYLRQNAVFVNLRTPKKIFPYLFHLVELGPVPQSHSQRPAEAAQ